MLCEDQFPLFDDAPWITPKPFARAGSQRWLQVAVNRAPHLLMDALRSPLGLNDQAEIIWKSPLENDGYREYRDRVALRHLGIHLPKRPLSSWWPEGGPVWDGIARVSDGQLIFLEAKAHIGEIFSPGSKATPASHKMIERSLNEARHYYTPGSRASWSSIGYQYANRLAWHYFLHTVNGLPSRTIFLQFVNCIEMNGPTSEQQWEKPIRYLHRRLGLPADFHPPGVHSIFFDVASLSEYAEIPPAPEPGIYQPWHQRLRESFME